MNNIKWKVVIVDECQQPNVSSQFAQIKVLATSVKILLYSGQLKVRCFFSILCFVIEM